MAVRWRAAGRTQITSVLYPIPKGKPNPVTAVEPLTVTNDKERPVAATALTVRFADGTSHAYFYAAATTGICTFGPYATDGRCALIRLNTQGNVIKAWQALGKNLRRNGTPLQAGPTAGD